jgi:threonine dehydratase
MVDDTNIDLGNIEEATRVVDPVFLNSPQFMNARLSAALGRDVLVKVETLNPLGSFKGRGADFLVRSLPPGSVVVCATSGNLGMAIAYAGQRYGVGVVLYVPAQMPAATLAALEQLGAEVRADRLDPATAARAHADRHPGHLLIDTHPALAEGAATIGLELLRSGSLDAVLLPVGGASLITGAARWIKHQSPLTRVIGVCPAGAPAMAESWRAGHPVRVEPTETIADGLKMTEPTPQIVERMCALVDDMVQVTDTAITNAMHLAASTLGLLIEPSAAAGLAAILEHDLPDGMIATVITGAGRI